jgi:hypothetical protein
MPDALFAQWELPRSVIGSGATDMSGGSYALRGTVGQAIIGTANSTSSVGFFGFWYSADNTVVSVGSNPVASDEGFHITSLYPNPAMGLVNCVFRQSRRQSVRITMYDALGRRIREFRVGEQEAGRNVVKLWLEGLHPGLYFLWADAGGMVGTARISVVR